MVLPTFKETEFTRFLLALMQEVWIILASNVTEMLWIWLLCLIDIPITDQCLLYADLRAEMDGFFQVLFLFNFYWVRLFFFFFLTVRELFCRSMHNLTSVVDKRRKKEWQST